MRQADRIIVNTLANYALSVVQVVASLILVPTVVAKLGKDGYGLCALVTTAWTAFSILSNCIGRAMQRYIPLDLADRASGRLSRTFSTALAGYLLVGIFGAAIVWFAQGWLTSDAELTAALKADGRGGFLVACLWLAFGLTGFAYHKGLESLQRYELTGFYSSVTTVVRTVILIVLFRWGWGSITWYVAMDLGAAVVTAALCRRKLLTLLPDLKESVRHIDLATSKALATFAGVTVLVIVGNVLGANGFRVLVGKRLGMDQLGALSVVLTLTGLMWRLINDLSNVLAPAVSHLDARGDLQSVSKLLVSGTKYSVAVAATMCLVPVSVAGAFFHLWVGDDFKGLDQLATVLLAAQVALCLGTTAMQVLLGMGKLKLVGPIMFARGVVGLLAAYAYIRWIKPDLVGAALCLYGCQIIGESVVFMYVCGVVGRGRITAIMDAFVRPVLLALLASGVTWMLAVRLGHDRWWKLGVSVGIGEVAFLILLLVAGLRREERSHLTSFVSRAWGARPR